MAKPMRAPHRPSYWELAANVKKHPVTVAHESWISYLQWDGPIKVEQHGGSNIADDDVREILDRF